VGSIVAGESARERVFTGGRSRLQRRGASAGPARGQRGASAGRHSLVELGGEVEEGGVVG
jgi:hypothetical protein